MDKMFTTETLTEQEIKEIAEGSEGYDRGEAPVGRDTQNADDLADMVQLQKEAHEHLEMSEGNTTRCRKERQDVVRSTRKVGMCTTKYLFRFLANKVRVKVKIKVEVERRYLSC